LPAAQPLQALLLPAVTPERQEIERLVRGEHHEPHRLLGAHLDGDRVTIRAWQPDATGVVGLIGDDRATLTKIHPAGLFEVGLPRSDIPAYRLEVAYGDRSFAVDDPYPSQVPLLHRPGPQGFRDRPQRPQGQPITKAGNRLLRTTLHRAADHTRRQDPQLARIYHTQMVQRGNGHLGAVFVVAAHLAERAWTVMDCGLPYVVCDTDGTPVTPHPGQADHRRPLDRARTGPPAAAQQEGEGPSASPARTCP
jgi:hypothetical protein